jgi:hypothetical protein
VFFILCFVWCFWSLFCGQKCTVTKWLKARIAEQEKAAIDMQQPVNVRSINKHAGHR